MPWPDFLICVFVSKEKQQKNQWERRSHHMNDSLHGGKQLGHWTKQEAAETVNSYPVGRSTCGTPYLLKTK